MKTNRHIQFGPYQLDEKNECLRRDSQSLTLRPKAFLVLKYLLERPGELVSKQQLLEAVWPDTFVGDAVLKDVIRQLREILGDDAQRPTYIETAHRRGYRFIGVTDEAQESAQPVEPFSGKSAPSTSTIPSAPAKVFEAKPSISPLVIGREGALRRLHEWMKNSLAGERQLVFVTGEAGIGKTTLVESFLKLSEPTLDLRVARGQCLEQYGAGEPYLPIFDALTRLGRSEQGTRVIETLRQHAPTWLAQMPSLLSAAEREALQQQIAGATRERMLREIAEAIELLSADAPLVLVLEDLHWSDYSTLDLISFLARRRDLARLMVIGTYRPVEVVLNEHPLKAVKRELQAHGLCSELPVEYLDEETVAEYLSLRFPQHELPPRLARLIHRRTEGNPLFMVNVVNYLIEEKEVVERDGHWQLVDGLSEAELGVPENIRQLIEKQIERLSEDEQRVLEGASVVGMECSTVAISAGLNLDPVQVEEQCEKLVQRHQFLTPARLVELPDGSITSRYKFLHILYLETPYRRIPAMRRSQIHSRIGARGEAVYGDRVSEIAAELAMHFEQGRDYKRAAKYLLMAAENAAQRFAPFEAATLARRGLDAIAAQQNNDAENKEQELALLILLGMSLMAVKGFASSEVEEIYLRARSISEQQEASTQHFTILWSLGLFNYFRGQMKAALQIAEHISKLSEDLPDRAFHMEALRGLGVCQVDLGDFTAARLNLEKVFALYQVCQPLRQIQFSANNTGVMCLCYQSRALWTLGFPDSALDLMNRATAMAAKLNDTPSRIAASYFAAHLHQLRREPEQARELAEMVIKLAGENGLELWTSCGMILRGWAQTENNQLEEGIAQMRRGLASYQSTGAKLWQGYFLGLLAGALVKANQINDGLTIIDEALTYTRESEENFAMAELLRIKGELLMSTASQADEAEQYFRQASETAQRQQAKSWELRIAINQTRLFSQRGKHKDASKLLSATLSKFTEGFQTADRLEAETLLG